MICVSGLILRQNINNLDMFRTNTFLFLIFLTVVFVACNGSKDEEKIIEQALTLVSSYPSNGSQSVDYDETTIELTFDDNIRLVHSDNVTLNENKPERVTVSLSVLRMNVSLQPGTNYKLVVPKGTVAGRELQGTNEHIQLSFQTKQREELSLVVSNPSAEAKRVYQFLTDNYQQKVLTGTMANVSWNINEAEWVNKHTGKYPALNCFDYIHLYASPANWINYEDTKVVEEWWNANGLVAAMWHWNVPSFEGSTDYHFYTNKTNFDVSRAVQEGTYENSVVKSDLDKMADQLLLLKEKNIPVIWRPLHEAAGKWFWWGAKGAAAYRKLWILMFETFETKGLNNLIWVWTSETNDSEWYPGDRYVDILSRDSYNNQKISDIKNEYQWMSKEYPGRLVALSEFGTMLDMQKQWSEGVRWSWIMPWYDYERTLDPTRNQFEETRHEHADINYWNEIFKMKEAVSIDEMPNLKN